MNQYDKYTKEELIQEIERLKFEKKISSDEHENNSNRLLTNMISLRRTMSDVLTLLLKSKEDSIIDQALLLILRFFDVDRVYIGIFDNKINTVDFTHEVTYDGIISLREDLLRDLSDQELPWWIHKIKSEEDIIIPDVSQMPAEAAPEQHLLQLQEVKSLLALSVLSDGVVNGFIGLDVVRIHRKWTMLDVENLRMLADIISIAIDRKHAQWEMEHSAKLVLKSEAKFQMIFEKLPLGVEVYDESGILLDLNEADMNIFGTTREYAIGVNMFENPNIPESINKKLKNGEDVNFVLNYNFRSVSDTGYYNTNIKENKIKHLLVQGIPLKDPQNVIFGFLYIVLDNSENHQKAEQTAYNLTKLKVAVNTGESLIWEYDVATDKITVDFSLNEEISKNNDLAIIYQYQPTCLQDFIDTLHPDDVNNVYNNLFKPLLNGEINNYVAMYRRILGDHEFWFNSNVRSYKFNENGIPSKIVCYTSNITKQRRSEIELIKVKEADKLKSAFLANMSHEIRTPLNAIVGFSNIISETEDEQERQTYLDIIHRNNDLLLQLIDDILDFSKIESGALVYHIDNTDIKKICEEVALADSLKIKPGVKLIFDNDLPSISVKTDEKRITQVLSNFVNNAIKFTDTGNITISYKKEGKKLYVGVSDTGIGISENNIGRIFQRFIKINDFHQGTGLGLTICKTIIESLGGSIGVDSVLDKGSTFWFTLPLEESEKPKLQFPKNDEKAEECAKPEKHHSILIAEDTAENYFLMHTLLNKQYQLYHAWNGQEAIDLYKEHQPDMILMDIKMPVMDGFEATKVIRTLSETVPVIALTAFAYEKEKITARECRFTDYVVKPVDISQLRKLISKTLAGI